MIPAFTRAQITSILNVLFAIKPALQTHGISLIDTFHAFEVSTTLPYKRALAARSKVMLKGNKTVKL